MSAPVITYHNLTLTTQPTSTIFYREAGNPAHPTLLLLHGFPSSSHMYRQLIPLLAHKYHVIAPDLPGFGLTTVAGTYKYTFDNLADTIYAWVKQLQLTNYAIYIFDYGAPVGLRVALKDNVTAIISQNGNAYTEGLTAAWSPIQQYWKAPTAENREALRGLLTPESIKWQYTHGVNDTSLISPDGYLSDTAFIQRSGQTDIQLDLFGDYASNVVLYPEFQRMFKQTNVPILAVWGVADAFFGPAGAEAFKRDSNQVEVHMLDASHFALETHVGEIAQHILRFLGKHVQRV